MASDAPDAYMAPSSSSSYMNPSSSSSSYIAAGPSYYAGHTTTTAQPPVWPAWAELPATPLCWVLEAVMRQPGLRVWCGALRRVCWRWRAVHDAAC